MQNLKYVGTQIPSDVLTRLKLKARSDGTTLNNLVARVLTAYAMLGWSDDPHEIAKRLSRLVSKDEEIRAPHP